MCNTSISYYQQQYQLRDIRAAGNLDLVNHMSCQAVLRQVDRAFQAFFRRFKAGYPRFKSLSRFHSYTFPTYGSGCKLRENNKLYIMDVGELKVKLHRPIAGEIRTVTLTKTCGKWYAVSASSSHPLIRYRQPAMLLVLMWAFRVLLFSVTGQR